MTNVLKILTDSWCLSTLSFPRHLKAAYLELLIAQNKDGHLSIDDIKTILGTDYDTYWENKLRMKFEIDKAGKFYNDTDIKVKDIEKVIVTSETWIQRDQEIIEKKKVLRSMIEPYVPSYGSEMCTAFYKYWGEPNKSKTKLKWEMQPTWEMGARMKRWKRTATGFKPKKNIYHASIKNEPPTAEDIEFNRRYEEMKRQKQIDVPVKSSVDKLQEKIGGVSLEDNNYDSEPND